MTELLKFMARILLVSGMVIFFLGLISGNTTNLIAGAVIMIVNYISINYEEDK